MAASRLRTTRYRSKERTVPKRETGRSTGLAASALWYLRQERGTRVQASTRRMCGGRIFALSFLLSIPVLGATWGAEEPAPDAPAQASRNEPGWSIARESKIRFDLERLNPEGLQGPPGGLRALHYEYCIPHRNNAIDVVTAIDPTLTIQQGSPGRIGCSEEELLCLGHTNQPGYRAVLEQLASLPTVREIREAFFE